ncbi:MAG: two-component sensor histidine kinase [Rickettsiales bacterium]|nr:two-component sensor histidine kinase [Rickettsiales bacterium]
MSSTRKIIKTKPREFSIIKRLTEFSSLGRVLAISLAVAAVASGIATYAAMAGATLFEDQPTIVLLLLNLDLILALLLAFLIVRRIVAIWTERRRGSAGSRLHVKLVVWFGLVSVIPAIVVGVFSVSFFNLGVEAWFSERVRTALTESSAAAAIYLQEHRRNIRADAMAMARDLNRDSFWLREDPERFKSTVELQATIREISEAIVFDGDGEILARAGQTYLLQFETVPSQAMTDARQGKVGLSTSESGDRVRALVRLAGPRGLYLYIGRLVDPVVLDHMERSQGAVEEFERLEIKRSDIQINFALIFVVVGLLLLLAAVWIGLMFATQLSRPVSNLILATEKVRGGNLSVRVSEDEASNDEIGSLSRAFNRMTSELEGNRGELVEANLQLDERRRFTETVLEGVSAGIVGLDSNGIINISNRSASERLGIDLEEMTGQYLAHVVPEMATLLESSTQSHSYKGTEGEIRIQKSNETHTLLVRIGTEWASGEVTGFVVTFDDVSQLLAAQRKAAWADVARRIAHEIKNPLTPIQLSAERLKRKYIKEIESDPEIFENCTDTIIRHVEDIGRMVDEFSSFARLPTPTMKLEDLTDICRQTLFLYRNSQPNIEFETLLPLEAVEVVCDGRQFSQALTNLLKNAVEAIESRTNSSEIGKVQLSMAIDNEEISVTVDDNGRGLPRANREQLTDPYFTTRDSGTGLGLAIVRKIMEDHDGRVELFDSVRGGANARLILSRKLNLSNEDMVVSSSLDGEKTNGL